MLLLCRGVWKRHLRKAAGWLSEEHRHKCQGCDKVRALALAIWPECTCQGTEGQQQIYLNNPVLLTVLLLGLLCSTVAKVRLTMLPFGVLC